MTSKYIQHVEIVFCINRFERKILVLSEDSPIDNDVLVYLYKLAFFPYLFVEPQLKQRELVLENIEIKQLPDRPFFDGQCFSFKAPKAFFRSLNLIQR